MKVFVYGRGELSDQVTTTFVRFTSWFDLAEAVGQSGERIAIIVLDQRDLDQVRTVAGRTSYFVAVVLNGNPLLWVDGSSTKELPNGLSDIPQLN